MYIINIFFSSLVINSLRLTLMSYFDSSTYLILFSVAAMKIAIIVISLVLMATVEGGVFEDNGMTNIATIISDIGDIGDAGDDLDVMEARLEGLDAKQSDVEDVKTALTNAMDKSDLENDFDHPNV